MAQLAVVSFSPGINLSVFRQRQAVFASRIDSHFFNANVLDGLEQSRCCHTVGAASAQSASSPIACKTQKNQVRLKKCREN